MGTAVACCFSQDLLTEEQCGLDVEVAMLTMASGHLSIWSLDLLFSLLRHR